MLGCTRKAFPRPGATERLKRGVGQDYFYNYTDILNYQTAKVIDVVDGIFR
jgi:hypothetical protein